MRYSALGFTGAVLSGAAAGSDLNSDLLRVEHRSISVPGLAAAFDGYRIGFLSDIHLGAWVTNEIVESAVQALNNQKVDICLLGGDFIWVHEAWHERVFPRFKNESFKGLRIRERPDLIYETLVDLLKPLKAKDGIYAVYGNHDHWIAPSACIKSFSEAGIRILQNELVSIIRDSARLRIYGVDDYLTGTPQIPNWSSMREANEHRILLAHNPDYFLSGLGNPGFEFDLGIAGHTHGGQIKLPGIGALTYNISDPRLGEGFCSLEAGTVYTTRGLGVVELPFRLNCPPEVTIFTLTA